MQHIKLHNRIVLLDFGHDRLFSDVTVVLSNRMLSAVSLNVHARMRINSEENLASLQHINIRIQVD